jgi:hypothetical protein
LDRDASAPGTKSRAAGATISLVDWRPPCSVYWESDGPGQWQYNTSAVSLFEAAMNAIRWFNEWKGPRPRLNTVLTIHAGWPCEQKTFHVRAARVVEHQGLEPRDWLDG